MSTRKFKWIEGETIALVRRVAERRFSPGPKDGRGWRARAARVDPGLVGPRAFGHPAVRSWHRWVRGVLAPRAPVVLVTPCSNRKPYPLSPQSAKIRGVLRRLGLWDPGGPGLYGAPRGVEWLYLSDLLALVPYDRAHEYPACCYELPPSMLDEDGLNQVALAVRGFLERNTGRIHRIILYLPRSYHKIIRRATQGLRGIEEKLDPANYHLLRGHKNIEKKLATLLEILDHTNSSFNRF